MVCKHNKNNLVIYFSEKINSLISNNFSLEDYINTNSQLLLMEDENENSFVSDIYERYLNNNLNNNINYLYEYESRMRNNYMSSSRTNVDLEPVINDYISSEYNNFFENFGREINIINFDFFRRMIEITDENLDSDLEENSFDFIFDNTNFTEIRYNVIDNSFSGGNIIERQSRRTREDKNKFNRNRSNIRRSVYNNRVNLPINRPNIFRINRPQINKPQVKINIPNRIVNNRNILSNKINEFIRNIRNIRYESGKKIVNPIILIKNGEERTPVSNSYFPRYDDYLLELKNISRIYISDLEILDNQNLSNNDLIEDEMYRSMIKDFIENLKDSLRNIIGDNFDKLYGYYGKIQKLGDLRIKLNYSFDWERYKSESKISKYKGLEKKNIIKILW